VDRIALLLGAGGVILDPLLDLVRGKAITIPPMDGAFRPNTALDEATALIEVDAPDNLAFDGIRLLLSSGGTVLARLVDGSVATLVRSGVPVSAVAAAPDGTAAVALDDGRILIRGGRHDGRTLEPALFGGLACPTALAFADPATLLVCQGSSLNRPADWAVDLMSGNAAGSLWRIGVADRRAQRLADGLAFPYGVLVEPSRIVVAESWRHRLVAIPREGGPPTVVLDKLPGYPARLGPARDGGAWLALFAPRNRLIEFVLGEDSYRADMMREIARPHWIAPALSSGGNFLEPLQCGAVRTMGIYKPWSPSRSYGLVVRLDERMQPVASFHSRANGRRHGITSVVEAGGQVLAAAKGGGAVLRLGAAGSAAP
jgi:hypothetical protein